MHYFNPNKIKKVYDWLKDYKDLVEIKNDFTKIDIIINSDYNIYPRYKFLIL